MAWTNRVVESMCSLKVKSVRFAGGWIGKVRRKGRIKDDFHVILWEFLCQPLK